jgi:hypothetical protein
MARKCLFSGKEKHCAKRLGWGFAWTGDGFSVMLLYIEATPAFGLALLFLVPLGLYLALAKVPAYKKRPLGGCSCFWVQGYLCFCTLSNPFSNWVTSGVSPEARPSRPMTRQR